MPYTHAELLKLKEETVRMPQYLQRNKELLLDWQLRNLVVAASLSSGQRPTRATPYVAERPKVYWDWVVAALGTATFRYEVPLGAVADEKIQGMLERFAYGIDAVVDLDLIDRGKVPWRVALAEQITSGSYAVFPDVRMTPKGEAVFTVEFWDPSTVYPIEGDDGWEVVFRVYRTARRKAEAYIRRWSGVMPPKQAVGANEEVEVTECWAMDGGKVINAVYIDGEVALPIVEQRYWWKLPIITGSLSRRPWENQFYGGEAITVESVLAPVRETIKVANSWDTLTIEEGRLTVSPHTKELSESGEPIIPAGGLASGESKHIPLRTGEDVSYLVRPPMQAAVLEIGQRFRRNIEEATVPDAVISGVNRPAFASGLLQSNLEDKAMIRLSLVDAIYLHVAKRVTEQWIRKFKVMGARVKIEAHDLAKKGQNGHFVEDFSAAKVPPDFASLQVTHSLSTGFDMNLRADLSIKLMNAGLQARESSMEMVNISDPVAEKEKILDDRVEADPFNVFKRAVEKLRKELLEKRKEMARVEKGSPKWEELDAEARLLQEQLRQYGGSAPGEKAAPSAKRPIAPDQEAALLGAAPLRNGSGLAAASPRSNGAGGAGS